MTFRGLPLVLQAALGAGIAAPPGAGARLLSQRGEARTREPRATAADAALQRFTDRASVVKSAFVAVNLAHGINGTKSFAHGHRRLRS
jgi:hypothetical protein